MVFKNQCVVGIIQKEDDIIALSRPDGQRVLSVNPTPLTESDVTVRDVQNVFGPTL